MDLSRAYDELKTHARTIAGAPSDILKRVRAHHAIYVDSRGNHAFPLIALHGALWGYDFFETSGKLGELIAYRYFEQALQFEQEITVAPGIARELAKFDCPILRTLCLKPIVRFAYFPLLRTFYFRDFSNKDERIDRALRSFDIAAHRHGEADDERVTA